MRKRSITILALSLLTGFSALAAVVGTSAWFQEYANLDTGFVNGASLGAYFAYGDGTKDNPYGISELRHLYNLAWLQYLDYFKRDNDDEDFDGLYYFELAADITAGENGIYHLPPIGTEDHPFIGQFNGQGYTISGVIFTNYDDFEKIPYRISANPDGFTPMDNVGMFGVVDSLSSDTENDTNTFIGNFGLSNVTVEAKTNAANLGIVVADLDGVIQNVAVDGSTVSIINNNGSSSDFTLVGKCDEKYQRQIKKVDESLYDINIHKSEFVAQDGDVQGWGGSIDMKEVHTRLNHIRKNLATSGVTRSGNRRYYFLQPTHHTTTYQADGTVNPGDDVTNTPSVTNTSDSPPRNTYFISGYYNEGVSSYDSKYGAYQFVDSSKISGNSAVMYMGGGHYTTSKYYSYRQHSGYPLFDGTNYATVPGKEVSTSSRLTVTSSINDALLWTFDNNGRLRTSYNNASYYLYRYNDSLTDLRFTTTANLGLVFAKETTTNNKFRYVWTNTADGNKRYYLKVVNNYWQLVALPTLRPEPVNTPKPTEVVEEPATRLPKPSIWKTDTDPGANSHYYYLYSGNNYLNASSTAIENATKSGDNNTSSTNALYWQLGTDFTSSEQTSTIKSVKQNRYLYVKRDSFFGFSFYSLTLQGGSNSANWTIRGQNGSATLKDSNYNRYLRFSSEWDITESSTNVSFYSVHQAYLDWQAYYENAELWNAYDAYVAAQAEYEDHEAWIAEQTQYNIENSKTYVLSETELVEGVQGPDSYLDSGRQTSGTDYTGQDVSYFPLSINGTNDDDLNPYYPKENNTGYFIGATTYSSVSDQANLGTTSLRFGAYEMNFKNSTDEENGCSLRGFNHESGKFDKIYTRNDSGAAVEIQNSEANYDRLAESRAKIESVLAGSSTGTSYNQNDVYTPNGNYECVFGMHFMQNEINKDNLVTARTAQILGKTKTNYEMPVSSVDFNLKEKGFINFFAGTYYHTGGSPVNGGQWGTVDSFFSLYDIFRDSNDKITDIKKISKVYSDGQKNHSYLLQYSDGNWSTPYRIDGAKRYLLATDGGDSNTTEYIEGTISTSRPFSGTYATEVFDTAWIEKSDSYEQRECYYFEIPINEGEYCLGSVANGSVGAYLIYLDINANAAQVDRTSFIEKIEVEVTTYNTPKGIVVVQDAKTTMGGLFQDAGTYNEFNYPIRQRVADSVDLNEDDSISIQIGEGYTGSVTLERSGETFSITRTGPPNNNKTKLAFQKLGSSITLVTDETEMPLVNEDSAVTTQTMLRATYYEINTTTNAVQRTIITKIGSANPVIVQEEYKDVDGTMTWVAVSVTKVYDDDGNQLYNSRTSLNTSSVEINHTTYQNSSGDDGVRLELYYQLEGDDDFDVLSDVIRDLSVAINQEDKTYYVPVGYTYTVAKGDSFYSVTVVKSMNTYNINVTTGNSKTGVTHQVISFSITYTVNE